VTGELIPLCHPLPITHCEVNFETPKSPDHIVITAFAKTASQTGVEMEALTAVSVVALTINDMCKAVDKTICASRMYGWSRRPRRRLVDRHPCG
jgi:cyclic pyranopterin phosphate synthase